jgi:spermidine/putrescine transport system permease protein
MSTSVSEPGSGPPLAEGGSLGARKRRVPYALAAPGALWLAGLFIVPMGFLAYMSLHSGGLLSGGGFEFTWEWSNYADSLTQNSRYFIRSIVYAGMVTAAALLLAYPLAYWIAFHGGRWKSTLLFLVLLPFFVSFVIRTVQWRFMLADNGMILGPLKDLGVLPDTYHVLATPLAVIAGITYNFLPFTTFPLYVSLERIDHALVEAAQDLYASRAKAFWKVVLPLSMPGVFAAVLLTFVPATGDYVDAAILGSPETTMIGNIIQAKFLVSIDYPDAAALSIVLMVGMLVLVSIYARVLGTEQAAGSVAA